MSRDLDFQRIRDDLRFAADKAQRLHDQLEGTADKVTDYEHARRIVTVALQSAESVAAELRKMSERI